MRDAFRTKGFGRLFVGLTLSDLGDSIMLIVLSMWVKELTGSNSMAGLTFLFLILPSLIAPILGVWVDRLPRKRVLVWGNGLSALAVLPLLLVDSASDVWIIWSVATLYGVAFVVLPAARSAVLKDMLPEEDLVSANSSIQTAKEGYRLIGPLIGAAVYAAFGGGLVAVVDSITFLLGAAAISTVPLTRESNDSSEGHGLRAEVMEGLRFLRNDKLIKHTLAGFALMQLVLGFIETSIYAVLDGFDKKPTDAAIFVTVQGVGAIVGGLLATPLIRRNGEIRTIILGMIFLGVPFGVAATAQHFTTVLICSGVIGLSLAPLFVAFFTLLQRRTPGSLIGRVSASVEVVLGSAQTLSLMVGAALVMAVSFRAIWITMSMAIVGAAAYIALNARRGSKADTPPLEQVQV